MKYATLNRSSRAFVIAEIGHNHQGDVDKAVKMIHVAAACGADAVKFQKRSNKHLYTSAMYNKPYDNENSFGDTYGQHREALEFDAEEYKYLMKAAADNHVEFMSTAFDFESVDFLEELGIGSYKVASGDLTSFPLLEYIAKKGKPMFVSTGASSMQEVKEAHKLITAFNRQLCVLHCIATYPSEYEQLNLNVIKTYLKEFPDTVIGYSSHENGIIGPILAYMLGATVLETHFTLNHAWKGTDHKFSLEPQGLQKMTRDLRRVDVALGNGEKVVLAEEEPAKQKMGKSVYYAMDLAAGVTVQRDHLTIKSPAGHLSPVHFNRVIGKKLKLAVSYEKPVEWSDFE
jgi:N-acetylneuraminate synthase/sialic acid synthase